MKGFNHLYSYIAKFSMKIYVNLYFIAINQKIYFCLANLNTEHEKKIK